MKQQEFWNAIWILLRNYHAVNRKISTCVVKEIFKITNGIELLQKCEENSVTGLQDLMKTSEVKFEVSTEDLLQTYLGNFLKVNDGEMLEGFLIEFKFLNKKQGGNICAFGIIDFTNLCYTCKLQTENFDDFKIHFRNNEEISVEILTNRLAMEKSKQWVEFVLQPKLEKWRHCSIVSDASQQGAVVKKSLQLVDPEGYNNLYKKLKEKYAQKAQQFWLEANESTDPLKFIYEDLAIAAYLICLWRQLNAAPKGFADLGCGNGLLVYILSEEGFNGYGYDIRARKLWQFYPMTTKLIEKVIEPEKCIFPKDVDWLIGNHSDELSAWLPILAANASYEMCYFLLPCCAYELSGAKFQRRNAKVSVYQDFLSYAQEISIKCGYETLQDRLKIPSTKRHALVGARRTHSKDLYAEKLLEIQNFITFEKAKHGNNSGNDEIKFREKIEPVRNCTKVDKVIMATLVSKIFQLLLNVEATSEKETIAWQTGRALLMQEIVQHLTPEDLKHIKAQFGGIKTLLRNKHEIFEFCAGSDLVKIKKPQKRSHPPERKPSSSLMRKRQCFFKDNHPNGCPLTDEECSFIH